MSDVKHEPGPWTVCDTVLQFGDCRLDYQIWGKTRIGFIEGQNFTPEAARANAELIAAAPETKAKLEELIIAADLACDTQCDNGEGLTEFNAALRRLEDAIEKARA